MSPTSNYLALAGLQTDAPVLSRALADLDLEVLPVARLEELHERLAESPPVCLLVDSRTPAGEALVREVRLSSQLADTAIIAMVQDPWGPEASAAFLLGADDFLPAAASDGLVPKVHALRREGPPSQAFLSGKAVLADPDRERRVHLARNLRKMGFDIQFAVENTDIPTTVDVKLVVANLNLPPDGAGACLQRFRANTKVMIPWIITGPRVALEEVRQGWLAETSQVEFLELETDPAQIVFTVNKMLIGAARSMRRSPRLLFGTTVRFAEPGPSRSHWGYCYNINRGGLYIRTLTPPALGTQLALEFSPPHGRGRVQVESKVVWRQEYSGSKGYPPGFGIQYAEPLPLADGAALEAGYNQLLADNGNPEA